MRFWPRGATIRWRRRRGFVAALLIVNQFVVASGLPLPASAATPKKDLSKPFPCMYLACGCMNADQCWHSCCCFTMREKLAWAEQHGVEPPAFVREAAAREALADAATPEHRDSSNGEKHFCCCCCCKQHSHDDASTSDTTAASVNQKQSDQPIIPPAGKSVVLLMALQCQGHSLSSILAQALPAIVLVVRRYDFLPLAEVCIFERSFESIHFLPAVPPPKISAAAHSARSVAEQS